MRDTTCDSSTTSSITKEYLWSELAENAKDFRFCGKRSLFSCHLDMVMVHSESGEGPRGVI
jgi:hypothetical protein